MMYGRDSIVGPIGAWMMGKETHPWLPTFMIFIAAWSLFWKGLALWKSARNDERYWFIALLVINTVGILEMLYLFLFAKNKYILVSEPKNKSKK